MNKKHVLLSAFLIAALATLNVKQGTSKIAGPPVGSVNDPITQVTCAQSGCHPSSAITPINGDLNLKIGVGNPTSNLDGFVYTPGTQYSIGLSLVQAVTALHPFYGFQIVALDANNKQAGIMATLANSLNTKIVTDTGATPRQYMGHKAAGTNRTWSFKWTSPGTCVGPITFYYAYNKCASDSSHPTVPSGTIYAGTATITCNGVGIEDISSKVNDLNIFPNPVSNRFGLYFTLKENSSVNAQLYSLNGELLKQLINEKINEGTVNRQFDVNNLSAGIYLLKLNVGEASVTRKIVIQ